MNYLPSIPPIAPSPIVKIAGELGEFDEFDEFDEFCEFCEFDEFDEFCEFDELGVALRYLLCVLRSPTPWQPETTSSAPFSRIDPIASAFCVHRRLGSQQQLHLPPFPESNLSLLRSALSFPPLLL
ncbi:MAG: hypothetical protein H6637_05885 [Ardenticatenales bacterium]|nr:hypothetical protein [Ardenticatenales bacterium]